MVECWSSMNGTLGSGSSVKRKEEWEREELREGAREERGSEEKTGKGRMEEGGEGE